MADAPLTLPDEPYVPAEFEALARRVGAGVSPRRFRHILGVTTIARALAARFDLELRRVTKAALLHDIARDESAERLRELAARDNYPLPPPDYPRQAGELHAPAAATIAQEELGITDAVVLEAVRRHTYGEGRLGPVGAALFIADKVEPRGRGWPNLPAGFQESLASLDRALLFAYDFRLRKLLEEGKAIDVRSVHARNALVERLGHAPEE